MVLLLHDNRVWVCLRAQGQCFTATAEKYTYEVCPFGSAAQKEGGSSTRCSLTMAGGGVVQLAVDTTTHHACGSGYVHPLGSCLAPHVPCLLSPHNTQSSVAQRALLHATGA